MNFLKKLFGTQHDRALKILQPQVEKINSLEPQIKTLSETQLQAKTGEFKEKLDQGASLEDICFEAFAVCREAAWRRINMRHYDVQLIGGLVLHQGAIAEMRTGEGKTLVATLPVYLNGLSGKGVHVVTVNDYLATRDCEWMGSVYRWLGLTTGTIVHTTSHLERKESYQADISYGTNNEFGFDYLRDNMKFQIEDYVQRKLNYAIVDECDCILIDEARTPLIISGPSEDSVDKYYTINKVIPHLKHEVHFSMEEKGKTVSLTEEGNAKVEELLKIRNIFEPENLHLLHHIYQGLKAHHLFKKDVDYMINKDNEVVIVDEFTGRIMEGRRWGDGLHQAVEAKEGVSIRRENQTLATITFQNYFRMYTKLAGMTGTAETEAIEFKKIYNLDVMVIPTNKPIRRTDHDDVIYKTENAKYSAIAEEIKSCRQKGQPVLVGTVSIEKSERISQALQKAKVTHKVLNAKHHEKEADIVAQAGRKNSVTIATNMAGRGTDIVLGGNPEFMAKQEDEDDEAVEKYLTQCEQEKQEVINAGGLYIIGTERHESRRIDNQLRGRSGRQGDPGESKFFLSLEDDLMRIFNGERLKKIMGLLKVPDDEPIVAKMVTRAIEGAQRKVEGHNFDIRKHLLEYDDVMNQQRTSIYSLRKEVLEGTHIDRIILDMLGEVTSFILDNFANEQVKPESWDLHSLNANLTQQFGIQLDPESLKPDQLINTVSQAIKNVYDNQKQNLGTFFPPLQKMVLLETIDVKWKEHLAQMDHLKEGINLRAYAQKDPLIEYKKEAFMAFETVHHLIRAETIEKIMKVQIVPQDQIKEQRKVLNQHDYQEGEWMDPFALFPQDKPAPNTPPPKLTRAERRRQARLAKKRQKKGS